MTTQNSWNNQVTAAGVTLNGGVTNIGTDAAANAVNIGTGAAAKTVTVGNITGATAVNVNTGTGDYTLASATGTLMSALDTGEVTKPLQPAFLATSSGYSNVTGDGTVYKIVYENEIFDQNSDYNNTTGIFTAPVTGRYFICARIRVGGLAAANTNSYVNVIASNRNFQQTNNPGAIRNINNDCSEALSALLDMDAGDTAYIELHVLGGTKVVDVKVGVVIDNIFAVNLVC